MSKYIVDIHGEIEGDYEIIEKYQESKTEWIPVSERLPKKSGKYLAYIVNPYDEKLQYSMTCHYSAKINSWFPDDETASANVIAWMPLPEPLESEN